MFGGRSSKIVVNAKKGSAADVTPDAVNWPNLGSNSSLVSSITQTITGINTTITLMINYANNSTNNPCDTYVYLYSKNGGTFTSFTSGSTVSISNNDTLRFQLSGREGGGQLTVINTTDNNAIIDTLTLTSSRVGATGC